MMLVCLSDVDKRQHHKDECLQGDNQDVEDCPSGAGSNVANSQQNTTDIEMPRPRATHQRNEHEQICHLADRYCLSAETHDAEDGEETHCGAECHSASFHQTHEQEEAHGHQDEDEHEVAAQAAGIIEFVGDE